MAETYVLPVMIFLAAILYSSVGHAGASGYLAAMALFGVAPMVMKPSALALNILVASIATYRFYRAGSFSWKIFWPFAVASIPLAFVGGALAIPDPLYKKILGGVLWVAAWRLWLRDRAFTQEEVRPLPTVPAIGIGAGMGLLSGLTGVGGGIFLSPLLWFTRWAEPRTIAGVSAAFILVNSIAGMLGLLSKPVEWPFALPIWAVSAVAGGTVGSRLGSRRLGTTALKYLLAVVLIIAGAKLLFS